MQKSVYRIIDANFNRSREALRVIEEYCRFVLNSSLLSARTKQMRHQLCTAVLQLDKNRLAAARDTAADVGTSIKIKGQLQRTNLKDTLSAACKRLPEALRVLAEMSQPVNRTVAKTIEDLRYQSYTLEKDIVMFAEPAEKFRNVTLYIIITSDITQDILSLTAACIEGRADCLQLRCKSLPDDELFKVAVKFVELCRAAGVISIINDRPDIAVACAADGLHLGQNDIPLEAARKLFTMPMITGLSTHSPAQLKAACKQLPVYVGLGPVFATGTKPDYPPVGIEYVKQAKDILADTPIRAVAIGALDLDNVAQVLQAGADAVAVCSAVIDAKEPKKQCQKLKRKISRIKKKLN